MYLTIIEISKINKKRKRKREEGRVIQIKKEKEKEKKLKYKFLKPQNFNRDFSITKNDH